MLRMLELVEEGMPTHSDDWLSEVPHRMDGVELQHDELAGHSEFSAFHQYL